MVEHAHQIVDYFERQYGLVAAVAMFILDFDSDLFPYIFKPDALQYCGKAHGAVLIVRDECAYPFFTAHEYVHILTDELDEGYTGQAAMVDRGNGGLFRSPPIGGCRARQAGFGLEVERELCS